MKLRKYQIVIINTIIITVCIVGYYLIRDIIYYPHGDPKENNVLIGAIFTVLVSSSIILVNFPIFKKIKRVNINLFKRLMVGFLITSVSASAIITIWLLIFYFFLGESYANYKTEQNGLSTAIFDNILIAVIVNLIIGAFFIIQYSTKEWKKALVEAEKYKRKSIESQYSVLVNQINPHFLFNSMNALASLIPQSPEKAVEFVNCFSKIYRYVLEVKDKIVCELQDELDFLDSYIFLQKIRFGSNFIIEKQIESEILNSYVPPLSLQLLVENAIKHNEISKTYPLTVTISYSMGYLIVRNNLRRKIVNEESAGVGLNNLRERFEYLTDLKPRFYLKNNEYIAKIPLIEEE